MACIRAPGASVAVHVLLCLNNNWALPQANHKQVAAGAARRWLMTALGVNNG